MSEQVLRERLNELTLAQKVRLLTGADFWALHAEPAAGLRRLVTSDGPAGVRGERWDEREPSANVPSPTLLAATWDEQRIERLGRLLAAEARRKGVDVVLAPMVNLHRTPYGGRHFESFSEDPLLTGRIGAAYVRGLQAEGVAATVKHFVANDSETERFTLDARVDERPLRELYLAPFEAIVRDAGAWTVMAAYNSVNGTTMTESPMLQAILHDEWGWDGLVMSDWTAARSTEGAGNAALDLAMPGPDGPWGDALVAAVDDGRVSEEAVDAKVLRLLRLAARVGALEGVEPAATAAPWSDEEIAAELRATAAAGFVLARNDGTLPLDGPRGSPCSAPAPPRRARSAAAARRSSRPTRSRRSTGLRAAGLEVTHARGRARAHADPAGDGRAAARRRATCASSTATAPSIASEHRHGAAFTWLGSLPPGTDGDRAARHAAPRRPRRARRRRHRRRPPHARARRRAALRPPDRALARRRPRRGRPAPAAARRARGARTARPSSSCATSPRPAARSRPSTSTSSRRSGTRTPSWSAPSSWRARPTWRWSWSAPTRRSSARASTATRSPCRAARTSSSPAWRPPTRAPSWSSTPARRCCSRGRTTSPRSCSPGSRARSSATRWPTSSPAPSSPAGGCRPRGRPPRTACPRPSRRTASCATTRACSSATAPTSATAARRCFPFGHGLGYTTWEYLAVEPARRPRHGPAAQRRRPPRPRGRPGLRVQARQRDRAAAALAGRLRRRRGGPGGGGRGRRHDPAASARPLGRRLDRRARRVPLRGHVGVVNTRSPAIDSAASGAVQRGSPATNAAVA